MLSNIIVQRCDFGIGQFIGNGRYQVGRILGEGAFGKVFKVQEPGGGEYALKLLKLWEITPELRKPLIDRFKMEYETGQIKSDYLVQALANGFEAGNPYIVMEYCAKGNLVQYMKHANVDMLNMACYILYGLNDLHKNGKVHRDLKPENVLIRDDGTAALTDFGTAGDRNKRMTERSIFGRSQHIFGTYAYMPPEQANRKRGDATVLPTTDIFSFGVMMYRLLTGKLPFGELNTRDDLILYQQKGKEGKWDRKPLGDLPSGNLWEAIIYGCLEPDFKHRLQSAQEVLKLIPPRRRAEPIEPGPYLQKQPGDRGKRTLLRIMQGRDYGKAYDLARLLNGKRIITVGRDLHNHICLRDDNENPCISRKHCTIETDESHKRWFIRDGQFIRNGDEQKGVWRESVNGTFVDSVQVTKDGLELKKGNIITIGYTTLRVE
ncbi:hypothetical protein FACS1894181_04580 [Bacteroidia bacterium]|nr:hypothetical protein FACS1894181_04580 [Bacteroidia bacterium]